MNSPFGLIDPFLSSFDTSGFGGAADATWMETAIKFLQRGAATIGGAWAALMAGRLARDKGRDVAHSVISGGRTLLRTLTDALLTSPEKAPGWFAAMSRAVAPIHIATGMATYGAAAPPKPLLDRLKTAATRQGEYLKNFRDKVIAGVQKTGVGAAHRASLYAETAWETAQNAVRAFEAQFEGEERRVLGHVRSEHCSNCLSYARRGWQPAGTLPEIGDSECGAYCKCFFEYRGGAQIGTPALDASLGLRFIETDAAKAIDSKVVDINVHALNAGWQKDADQYIPPGGSGGTKYRNALAFVQRAIAEKIPVDMGRVTVDPDGTVSFTDGRHRFAAMRDLGATAIPVNVDPADAARLRTLYGAGR